MAYEETLSSLIFGEKEKMEFWGYTVHKLHPTLLQQTHSSGILNENECNEMRTLTEFLDGKNMRKTINKCIQKAITEKL